MPNHIGGEPSDSLSQGATTSSASSHPSRRNWKLYMPKSYHPLLLKRHLEDLHNAKKDVVDATAVSSIPKYHLWLFNCNWFLNI